MQSAHVQICSHNILGQLQLDDVWFCLLRHATKAANSPDDSRLHYDDFCQVHCQLTTRISDVVPVLHRQFLPTKACQITTAGLS